MMVARRSDFPVVAGVDVGGPRKGFHAVALHNGAYAAHHASREPAEIAAWCRQLGVRYVGVDAPCRWRETELRPAERALMAAGFSCFASPTRAVAVAHPTDYYGWMLNGERLFAALEEVYPLYAGEDEPTVACFETFPHAIACVLAGQTVSAQQKRTLRRTLLDAAGIDSSRLGHIDLLDGALCAVAADRFASGMFDVYGDARNGFIVLPRGALRRKPCLNS